jgi:hypothetical protein
LKYHIIAHIQEFINLINLSSFSISKESIGFPNTNPASG